MYPGDFCPEKKHTWRSKWQERARWQKLYVLGAVTLVMFVIVPLAAPLLPSAMVQLVLRALLMAGGILLAAGFIAWCWPFIRRLWAHWSGRIVLVILNALILLFATALARNSVSASLQLPPQDFDLTVAFFALPSYVFSWYLLLSIAAGIGGFVIFVAGFTRMIVGPSDQIPGWTIFHGCGALAVTFLLIGPFDAVSKFVIDKDFVRLVAYVADFHEASNYPRVLPKERIRLHENGIVSSATFVSGRVIITTAKREFGADSSCEQTQSRREGNL